MIAHSKKCYNGITFSVQDAVNLNYVNCFDLITSFSTIHWIKDQTQLFKNIFNALVDGGRFIGFLYPICPIQIQSLKKTSSMVKYNKYLQPFFLPYTDCNERMYRNIFLQTGFKINNLSTTKTSFVSYKDKLTLLNFIKTWLPHEKKLPRGLAKEFMHDFIEQYILDIKRAYNLLYSNDEIINVPFKRIEIDILK